MTKLEELNEKIEHILRECNVKTNELKSNYAKSNRRFKVGDIIKDNNSIIEIDDIHWGQGYSNPEPKPFSHGFELTKKLSRKKCSRI